MAGFNWLSESVLVGISTIYSCPPLGRSRRQRIVHKTRARMLVTYIHLQWDISLTLTPTNQFTCKYYWSPMQWTLDKTGLWKVFSGSMRKTHLSARSLNKTFIFSPLDILTLYLLLTFCITSSFSKLISLSEVERKARYLPVLLVETEQVLFTSASLLVFRHKSLWLHNLSRLEISHYNAKWKCTHSLAYSEAKRALKDLTKGD